MTDRQLADPSLPPVIDTVIRQSSTVLKTYQVDPGLIQEHANGERRITQGGYGERQLLELVQNAADEIAASPGGKLHVVLTETHLYCANEGTPVTPEGAETILRMSVSRKRGGQIGRFGVGIKSVLSVSDSPQFFSGNGAFGFGFDREWSAAEIAQAIGRQGDIGMDTPVLRMARPLDVEQERADDNVLDKLLRWATTVVRLPLMPGAAERLGRDISGYRSRSGRVTEAFPAHFQLFSSHVGQVLLHDERSMPPRAGRSPSNPRTSTAPSRKWHAAPSRPPSSGRCSLSPIPPLTRSRTPPASCTTGRCSRSHGRCPNTPSATACTPRPAAGGRSGRSSRRSTRCR